MGRDGERDDPGVAREKGRRGEKVGFGACLFCLGGVAREKGRRGEGEVADGAFALAGFEVPADDAGDGAVGEVADLLPVVLALHCISVTRGHACN